MTRIQRAQLAKVKIDWGELKVGETYPAKIPELWAGRPVIVLRPLLRRRRSREHLASEIKVSGSVEGEAVSWPLTVKLPAQEPQARRAGQGLGPAEDRRPDAADVITTARRPWKRWSRRMALDYRLMSQYTSFVAVDARKPKNQTEPAAPPRRMLVPVPLPEGTRWEGFFGEGETLGRGPDGAAISAMRLESVKESKKE